MFKNDREMLIAIRYNMREKVKLLLKNSSRTSCRRYTKIALLEGNIDMAKIIINNSN